jgi:hypothetical protein
MTLTQILVEHQIILQKVIKELQNNEHEIVCWLDNYGTNLCNQQIVHNQSVHHEVRHMEEGQRHF